ncbi:MAG: Permease of the drug/metabolite transporter (DMT) superfamily [Firmicutes bacterium]|nr:Permease of the drug/metabolite transporter (DMT) superfamily [Bacillota bacterium]MDI6706694.1 DMT family transporter [Bacillota bacterium]
MDGKLRGSVLVLVSAALFGIMGVMAKLAYDEGANALFVLTMRFSIAAAILWAFNLVPVRRQKVKVTVHQGLALFIIGGVIYFIVSMCYFSAINYIPVSLSSMIFYLYPVIVNAFMLLVLKERAAAKQVVALVMAMTGSVLMMWARGMYINWIGVLISLCASVFYSAYIILLGSKYAKILDGLDSVTVTTYLATFAAVSMAVTGALTGQLQVRVSPWVWASIIIIAVFSTVISSIMFYLGVREVGSSRASILSTFEPVVTVSMGVLVLSETLAPTQFIGMVLVISAVTIMNMNTAGLKETTGS